MKINKYNVKHKIKTILNTYGYRVEHISITELPKKHQVYELKLEYTDMLCYGTPITKSIIFDTMEVINIAIEILVIELQDKRGLNWIRTNLRITR